ncbi:MAG: FAD-binding oxidoreductase [archaeon]|nr:FAD-binding oxidoreductase [archaeon]
MNSTKLSREVTPEVCEKLQEAFGMAAVKQNEGKSSVSVEAKTTEEVATVMRIATEAGAAVSSCPSSGAIVIDISAMNKIEIDAENMVAKVQAGAKWSDVIALAAEKGLMVGSYPFDAEKSVESWVGSNGIGRGSFKNGPAKDNVMNLEVVLPNGTVVDLGYDNIGAYMSGYNLLQTFVGSRGTLGKIVSATVKLYPVGAVKAVSYKFADASAADAAIQAVVRHASLKPFDFLFAGNVISMTFQGEEKFVDFSIEAADALMEANGGAKCEDKVEVADTKTEVLVPVKNFGKFMEAAGADVACAAVADANTVLFVSNGADLVAAAAELGGRSATAKLEEVREEAAVKFMNEFRDFVTTGKLNTLDSDKLSRDVSEKVIKELIDIVGEANVNVNDEEKLLYCHDLAPLPKMAGLAFDNMPDAVVRVKKTSELVEIAKIAYKNGIAITPRGNSTWGLGGAMPTCGGIVVDFSSVYNKIEVDAENMVVKVQSGATWKAVLDKCMEQGFIVGSYPSSFPAATIGAWLATNGMGIGSYKYGSAKDNVMNIEVILPDGTLVNTGYNEIGAYKAGYNLNQLFAGSEGTLCLFGTVTLRIYPMGIIKPVAYEFKDKLSDANVAIQAIVNHASLKPLHISWSDFNHFANQKRAGCHAPDVRNIVLVTYQGDEKFVEMDVAETDAIMSANGGARVADEIGEHEWEERCYEFRARKAGVGEIPAEVITPTKVWGEFIETSYQAFGAMKSELGGIIGEIVDRNTALFMPYYFKDDESLLGMLAFAFNFYLGDRAMEVGGRTTGFGVFFAWNLDNIHDANTVALMRSFKTFVDPHDVMNPGHVVCGMTSFGINMSHGLMSLGSVVMQTMKKIMPQNKTFANNLERFRYNTLEEEKAEDRKHVLGRGYE